MLRKNLVEYQAINNCGKVTIDNIRRSLSTFFSWLEEEDYIIKSPMKRIHKVKTAVIVKENADMMSVTQIYQKLEKGYADKV